MFALGIRDLALDHAPLRVATGALLILAPFVTRTTDFVKDPRRHSAALEAPAAFGAVLFLAYVGYIFRPRFFSRYFFPTTLPLLLLLAVVFDSFARHIRWRSVQALFPAVALACAVAVPPCIRPLQQLFVSDDTTSTGYMNLGPWARHHFSDRTAVGCSQSGALAYFAHNLRVTNLDGVVSRECMTSLTEFRNLDYI